MHTKECFIHNMNIERTSHSKKEKGNERRGKKRMSVLYLFYVYIMYVLLQKLYNLFLKGVRSVSLDGRVRTLRLVYLDYLP